MQVSKRDVFETIVALNFVMSITFNFRSSDKVMERNLRAEMYILDIFSRHFREILF